MSERKELLDLHKSKWEGMMTSRADKEDEYMKKRDERVERYEKDLQDLRIKDAEEYNQLKIKLETDVQVRQLCNLFCCLTQSVVKCMYTMLDLK